MHRPLCLRMRDQCEEMLALHFCNLRALDVNGYSVVSLILPNFQS